MLQDVIDLQTKAVSELLEMMNRKREITFKAPTGSGKTYMMADFMNKFIEENKNSIFIVSALSKGDLAQQNYKKFIQYKIQGMFQNINPYMISSESYKEERLYIPCDSNVYVLARDLYKNKSKLKQGAFLAFLSEMKYKNKMKIYLIKDESHIATKNLDELSKEFFDRIINFSATPKLTKKQLPDVEITESDAINAHLIKSVNYKNPNDSLEKAIELFKKTKEKYLNLVGINPCMIIQISNKDKADEEMKNIMSVLDKNQDLKWISIVDKEQQCDTNDFFRVRKLPVRKWKDYVKDNSATIDIIIFKMVISEGWDIPRACMLYQIRDSKSKQLDEQVIGRVRRNPKLLEYENLTHEQKEVISTAMVWGITENANNITYVKPAGQGHELQHELKVKTTVIDAAFNEKKIDIANYIEEKKQPLVKNNIFNLYRKYQKAPADVKKECDKYINEDVEKWFNTTELLDGISLKIKEFNTEYSQSMRLRTDDQGNILESTLPPISYFFGEENIIEIYNWMWERLDEKNIYYFDSYAEKTWAEILVGISKNFKEFGGKMIEIGGSQVFVNNYVFGKNYPANSEIKYEYYMDNNIHTSYPDFILKDAQDRIHIIEVKSTNKSNSHEIKEEIYEDKARELIRAYKEASKLTGYYFYVPILVNSEWKITACHDGTSEQISMDTFKKFIAGEIKSL